MQLSLRDVEPSNIPPVDNHTAAAFMRHLTGRETFDWTGTATPRSVVFYDVRYAYPRISSAAGWLLSIDLNGFQRAGLANRNLSGEASLKRYVIGKLDIEFGGTNVGISVRAVPLRV